MKKVLLTITNVVLFVAILIFVTILCIKHVTIDTLYNTMLTQKIRQSITQYNSNIFVTNDDVKLILEKYIDIATLDKNISIENEMKLILDNYDLTEDQKDEIIEISKNEINNIKKNLIEQYNSNEKDKKMVNLYKTIISSNIKIVLSIIIGISIISLIILEKSLLEWIVRIGLNMLIIGFSFMFLLPSIIKSKAEIEISYMSISNYGAKVAAFGLALNIIYCVIEIIRMNFTPDEEEDF